MSSPCAHTFETPELLEDILLQLPTRDLLLAQCVSRCFETTIKSSPRLQQALYFRAAPLKDTKAWSINPMLRAPFLPWFALCNDTLNFHTIELLDWLHDDSKTKAFLYKNASWRKMLAIQPPPKKLAIVEFCHGQCGDDARDAEVSFEETQGVTMDAIYDITEAFVRNEEISDFGLSIMDSETGPQATLYLRSTMQCCPGGLAMRRDLKSQGATHNAHRNLQFVFRKIDAPEGGDDDRFYGRRISMDWKTDLTPERGGVGSFEFQKWQRERVPISSILSDIR